MELGPLEDFLEATGPLAVVDLETTGLSQDPESEMLEFGAALLDRARNMLLAQDQSKRWVQRELAPELSDAADSIDRGARIR